MGKSLFVRLLLLLVGSLLYCAGRADYVYTLIDDAPGATKTAISLKSAVAPDASSSVVGKGTALIQFKGNAVAEKWLKDAEVDMAITVSAAPYQTVSGDTYYRITGGFYTLDKDVDEKNVAKSGLDIKLKAGTKFSVKLINNAPSKELVIAPPQNSPIELGFPFSKSDPSGPSQIKATANSLEVTAKGLTGSGQVLITNVHLAGISIPTATLNWALGDGSEQAPKSELTFTCPSLDIAINFPGTTSTQANSLLVSAKDLTLDADGEFSFSSASATFSNPLRIGLANPANFAILVKNITLEMEDGEVSSVLSKFDLELPPQFSLSQKVASSSATPQPVLIRDILINWTALVAEENGALPKFSLVQKIPQDIKAHWGDFSLVIKKGAEIDLDSKASGISGEPADWVGVFIPTGTLEFSNELQKDATKVPKLEVTNFAIGSAGVSGTANGSNLDSLFKAPFFKKSSLSTVSLEFLHGQLINFDASGKIYLEELKNNIDVRVTVTGAGVYTLNVDPSQSIKLGVFGDAVSMNIEDGSYSYDAPQNLHKVNLSGSFSVADNITGELDTLAGLTFSFQDLSIDSEGKFALGGAALDLPNPVLIDLGPALVSVSQFGIVQINQNGVNYPGILLTGEVSVEDLPVSGTIGFDGITIYYTGSPTSIDLSKLKADWKKIGLDITVAKVGRLTASVEKGFFPDPGRSTPDPVPTFWPAGKTVKVIRGSGSLTLECFGSGSTGIGIDFFAAPKSWYVGVDVDPPNPVKLGSTGLQISKFRGGLGRNVTSPTGDSGMVGVPIKDYKLVPIPEDLPASTPNVERKWLFTAGIRIGTLDDYTAWGDVNLTAAIGEENFMIDLDGKFYILEEMKADIETNFDRRLLINLHYDSGENSFRAYAQADLYFPDRSSKLIYAYAPVELYLSPDHKFFKIGGDVTQNPGSAPSFVNPATVSLLNGRIGGQGVVVIDLDRRTAPAKFAFKAGAKVWYDASFNVDITSKLAIAGWIKANGYVYFDAVFVGDPDNPNSKLKFNGANGQVGFGVSVGGKFKNPIKDLNFSASADADLTGYLSPTYAFSATGTVSGRVKVGKFNTGFSTSFSIN